MFLALLILKLTQPLNLLTLLRLEHLHELSILQSPEQPIDFEVSLPLKSALFYMPTLCANNVRISPASVGQVSRKWLARPIPG